jgi:catechol 2,3-dioxygenase-like lactoylglutathione lyase family enzyme
MLLDGVNHVALLTDDLDRFEEFWTGVFGAVVDGSVSGPPGMTLTFIRIGSRTELNVFSRTAGGPAAGASLPRDAMFGRGPIDHLGVQAASIGAFETIRARLMERGAADDFVSDFGPVLSIFFRDPDGLECEVCIENPDVVPGKLNPPGTRAARYPAP